MQCQKDRTLNEKFKKRIVLSLFHPQRKFYCRSIFGIFKKLSLQTLLVKFSYYLQTSVTKKMQVIFWYLHLIFSLNPQATDDFRLDFLLDDFLLMKNVTASHTGFCLHQYAYHLPLLPVIFISKLLYFHAQGFCSLSLLVSPQFSFELFFSIHLNKILYSGLLIHAVCCLQIKG